MARPEDIKKKIKEEPEQKKIIRNIDEKEPLVKELIELGCRAKIENGCIYVLVSKPEDVQETKALLDAYFEAKDYHSSYGVRYSRDIDREI